MSTATPEKKYDVTEALMPYLTSLEGLREHPDNPRKGDLTAIAESLKTFGQIKPIVALPSGEVVAGNHTMKAAASLGWTHMAAVVVDLTDAQARQYLLADNRASDMGEYDQEVLGRLLEDMMSAGQLDGTGYSPDDVDDLLASMDKIAETAPEEFRGDFAEPEEATAGRYHVNTEHRPMKQFILLFEPEHAESFGVQVKALMKEWGIDEVRSVVREAVRRAVEGVDEGAAPVSEEALQAGLEAPIEGHATTDKANPSGA